MLCTCVVDVAVPEMVGGVNGTTVQREEVGAGREVRWLGIETWALGVGEIMLYESWPIYAGLEQLRKALDKPTWILSTHRGFGSPSRR